MPVIEMAEQVKFKTGKSVHIELKCFYTKKTHLSIASKRQIKTEDFFFHFSLKENQTLFDFFRQYITQV